MDDLEVRIDALVGRYGQAYETLHPSGIVLIEGESIRDRAERCAYIAPRTAVEVVSAEFGEIVVRAIDDLNRIRGDGG